MITEILLAFSLDFNIDVKNYPVYFKDKSAMPTVFNDPYRGTRPADGFCGKTFLTINKQVWVTLNKWQKHELIYHELGHCILYKEHTKSPEHIMNSFAPNKFWVNEDGSNWEKLVNRMKNE